MTKFNQTKLYHCLLYNEEYLILHPPITNVKHLSQWKGNHYWIAWYRTLSILFIILKNTLKIVSSANIAEHNKLIALLHQLKRLRILNRYSLLSFSSSRFSSVLMFWGIEKRTDEGQITVFGKLFVGNKEAGSIYHDISWSFQEASRVDSIIPFSDIFLTYRTIDTRKTIVKSYEPVVDTDMYIVIVVESKDLCRALTTQYHYIYN